MLSAGYPLVCLDTASPVDNQAGRDYAILPEPTSSHTKLLENTQTPTTMASTLFAEIGCTPRSVPEGALPEWGCVGQHFMSEIIFHKGNSKFVYPCR
jgi:hypothetical protein